MAAENRLWGQKRIQAELARLGFQVPPGPRPIYARVSPPGPDRDMARVPDAACIEHVGLATFSVSRFADGDARRFPAMAEAFVREKASVIVVFSEAGAHAAEDATRTIPIVAVVEDFVAKGVGASVAKPGATSPG